MADLTQLQRFVIPGIVRIDTGAGGLPRLTIDSGTARAEIYLQGGHLTAYQPAGAQPVLFLSAQSHFAPGKAIRGGVPVIFPWFGPKAGDPSAGQHGFARTSPWTLRDVQQRGDAVLVTLALGPSEATRRTFPHDFELSYTIAVGSALDMSLTVRNTSESPFVFEQALHTYLRVGDVRTASIEGLGGRAFIDKVDGAARKTQPPGAMRLTGETDRVYLNTPDAVSVADPAMRRRIEVDKEGSASTVIWNPWTDKAHAMADFGDDEWPGMLCVETANVADNAIRLSPGQHHTMRATVRVA